ncbi:hypothetical protein [Calothrix sp. PCC 6303]|jgi:hypothetical protein|uniref:hypothetical protein n=1 Tax=Calothrix sp. PCC 6303 TaxID=1170562 RepID=UPI0002A02885|nr:hypothetical protein [Calothrix sp. PCC 6303]AFZ04619.1 hypothetical protein Cal6303_5754 [Calothrix sp. PCC 6303]
MPAESVTLQIPEIIYTRLVNTAKATHRPLEEVILRVLQIGSPPAWDDVPSEFQAEVAALDKLDDDSLWQIARGSKTTQDMEQYNQLLEGNSNNSLTQEERLELMALRHEMDVFMLCKAQAAVLLRWRGHNIQTR